MRLDAVGQKTLNAQFCKRSKMDRFARFDTICFCTTRIHATMRRLQLFAYLRCNEV